MQNLFVISKMNTIEAPSCIDNIQKDNYEPKQTCLSRCESNIIDCLTCPCKTCFSCCIILMLNDFFSCYSCRSCCSCKCKLSSESTEMTETTNNESRSGTKV